MSAQPQLREPSVAFESSTPQSPVRMKIKQRQSDDDRGTIMVLSNDPFQSLTPPSGERRASARAMNVTPPATLAYRWASLAKAEPYAVKPRVAEVFTQPPPSLRMPQPQAEKAPAVAIAPSVAPAKAAAPAAAPETKTATARDAWCAVVLMGMFIVGGIVWTSNRIASDESIITDLRTQLVEANATIEKKLEQIKKLYSRVTDAEAATAKARAASRANSR